MDDKDIEALVRWLWEPNVLKWTRAAFAGKALTFTFAQADELRALNTKQDWFDPSRIGHRACLYFDYTATCVHLLRLLQSIGANIDSSTPNRILLDENLLAPNGTRWTDGKLVAKPDDAPTFPPLNPPGAVTLCEREMERLQCEPLAIIRCLEYGLTRCVATKARLQTLAVDKQPQFAIARGHWSNAFVPGEPVTHSLEACAQSPLAYAQQVQSDALPLPKKHNGLGGPIAEYLYRINADGKPALVPRFLEGAQDLRKEPKPRASAPLSEVGSEVDADKISVGVSEQARSIAHTHESGESDTIDEVAAVNELNVVANVDGSSAAKPKSLLGQIGRALFGDNIASSNGQEAGPAAEVESDVADANDAHSASEPESEALTNQATVEENHEAAASNELNVVANVDESSAAEPKSLLGQIGRVLANITHAGAFGDDGFEDNIASSNGQKAGPAAEVKSDVADANDAHTASEQESSTSSGTGARGEALTKQTTVEENHEAAASDALTINSDFDAIQYMEEEDIDFKGRQALLTLETDPETNAPFTTAKIDEFVTQAKGSKDKFENIVRKHKQQAAERKWAQHEENQKRETQRQVEEQKIQAEQVARDAELARRNQEASKRKQDEVEEKKAAAIRAREEAKAVEAEQQRVNSERIADLNAMESGLKRMTDQELIAAEDALYRSSSNDNNIVDLQFKIRQEIRAEQQLRRARALQAEEQQDRIQQSREEEQRSAQIIAQLTSARADLPNKQLTEIENDLTRARNASTHEDEKVKKAASTTLAVLNAAVEARRTQDDLTTLATDTANELETALLSPVYKQNDTVASRVQSILSTVQQLEPSISSAREVVEEYSNQMKDIAKYVNADPSLNELQEQIAIAEQVVTRKKKETLSLIPQLAQEIYDKEELDATDKKVIELLKTVLGDEAMRAFTDQVHNVEASIAFTGTDFDDEREPFNANIIHNAGSADRAQQAAIEYVSRAELLTALTALPASNPLHWCGNLAWAYTQSGMGHRCRALYIDLCNRWAARRVSLQIR
jgi:hypothetical protein